MFGDEAGNLGDDPGAVRAGGGEGVEAFAVHGGAAGRWEPGGGKEGSDAGGGGADLGHQPLYSRSTGNWGTRR